MRECLTNKSWMYNANKELCGINFGSDFCAEHECGIAGIRNSFGIKSQIPNPLIQGLKKLVGMDAPVFGIAARVIKEIPADLELFGFDGMFGLGFFDGYNKNWLKRIFEEAVDNLKWKGQRDDADFISYWGKNDFFFATSNEANFKAIHAAIHDKEAAILLGGGKGLSNNGLMIVIPSKLDDEFLVSLQMADKDAFELKKAANATGIEERLVKAKKEFFSLSPAWKKNDLTLERTIHFWLNPQRQKEFNAGWYTVEELDQWIKGEGPIITIKKNENENIDFKKYEA